MKAQLVVLKTSGMKHTWCICCSSLHSLTFQGIRWDNITAKI